MALYGSESCTLITIRHKNNRGIRDVVMRENDEDQLDGKELNEKIVKFGVGTKRNKI